MPSPNDWGDRDRHPWGQIGRLWQYMLHQQRATSSDMELCYELDLQYSHLGSMGEIHFEHIRWACRDCCGPMCKAISRPLVCGLVQRPFQSGLAWCLGICWMVSSTAARKDTPTVHAGWLERTFVKFDWGSCRCVCTNTHGISGWGLHFAPTDSLQLASSKAFRPCFHMWFPLDLHPGVSFSLPWTEKPMLCCLG